MKIGAAESKIYKQMHKLPRTTVSKNYRSRTNSHSAGYCSRGIYTCLRVRRKSWTSAPGV